MSAATLNWRFGRESLVTSRTTVPYYLRLNTNPCERMMQKEEERSTLSTLSLVFSRFRRLKVFKLAAEVQRRDAPIIISFPEDQQPLRENSRKPAFTPPKRLS